MRKKGSRFRTFSVRQQKLGSAVDKLGGTGGLAPVGRVLSLAPAARDRDSARRTVRALLILFAPFFAGVLLRPVLVHYFVYMVAVFVQPRGSLKVRLHREPGCLNFCVVARVE